MMSDIEAFNGQSSLFLIVERQANGNFLAIGENGSRGILPYHETCIVQDGASEDNLIGTKIELAIGARIGKNFFRLSRREWLVREWIQQLDQYIGKQFQGTITSCGDRFYLVDFGQNLKGWLLRKEGGLYSVGDTLTVEVDSFSKKYVRFLVHDVALREYCLSATEHVGRKLTGTVRVSEGCNVFLDLGLGLYGLLKRSTKRTPYQAGDKVTVVIDRFDPSWNRFDVSDVSLQTQRASTKGVIGKRLLGTVREIGKNGYVFDLGLDYPGRIRIPKQIKPYSIGEQLWVTVSSFALDEDVFNLSVASANKDFESPFSGLASLLRR